MQKIKIFNKEYPAENALMPGEISVYLSSYNELDGLEELLKQESNLNRVEVWQKKKADGNVLQLEEEYALVTVYTKMKLLHPVFQSIERIENGIRAVFGLRPFTIQESQQRDIATALSFLTDGQALEVKGLHPIWSELIGKTVKIGTRFIYEDVLYKTIQDKLLIQEQYVPGQGTESIYMRIDESHSGSIEDPIPYHVNMEVFQGKYYTEDGILYKCTRDSGQALHNKASELVGHYFEIAE